MEKLRRIRNMTQEERANLKRVSSLATYDYVKGQTVWLSQRRLARFCYEGEVMGYHIYRVLRVSSDFNVSILPLAEAEKYGFPNKRIIALPFKSFAWTSCPDTVNEGKESRDRTNEKQRRYYEREHVYGIKRQPKKRKS